MRAGVDSSRRTTTCRAAMAAILVLAGICLLAWPGVALANYSTATGWYHLNRLPAGARSLGNVSMLGDEAWVSASPSVMLHSVDAGRTWRPLAPFDGTSSLSDLRFVSASTGWASRAGTGVLRSTDGGHTWATVMPLTVGTVDDLFALDATHAWALSNGYHFVYVTSDGGATWGAGAKMSFEFEDMAFASATTGWAVGNTHPLDIGGIYTIPTSTIYKTTDSGLSWTPVRTTTEEELFTVTALDATHVLAGGSLSPKYISGPGLRSPRTVRTADSGTNWTTTDPAGSNAWVAAFTFSTTQHGWASVADDPSRAGVTSAVLETTDGGASWSAVRTPGVESLASDAAGDLLAVDATGLIGAAPGKPIASRDLSVIDPSGLVGDLAFADVNNGWALCQRSIVHTANGGASWTPGIDLSTVSDLNAVWATSPTKAWVAGDGGKLWVVSDSGATWGMVDSTTSQDLQDIAFADADHGWVVGGSSLLDSVDGGASWNPNYPNGSHNWYGVACASADTVCVAGTDTAASRGCIERTTNGGATWDQVLTAPLGVTRLTGVTFVDALEGWAYGRKGSLHHTVNGGASWTAASWGSALSAGELAMTTVLRVAFRTALDGWALCDVGPTPEGESYSVVLSTTDGGATWNRVDVGTGGPQLLALARSGARIWLGGMQAALVANFDPDSVAAVTTSSYNGRWTNQPVSLALSGSDAGVGLAYTRFSWLAAPWVYGTALSVPAPTDHSNDGAWPLVYQSVDRLAQAETPVTQLVKIDTRAPGSSDLIMRPDMTASGYVKPNVTFRWSGLDWALPSNLAALSSVTGVDVSGQRAYLLDGTFLRVINVANPTSPVGIGRIDLKAPLSDVAAEGTLAYVASPEAGLLVVDASGARPALAGSCKVDGVAGRLAVTNGAAFVTLAAAGVAVVDVRDPAAPRQIGLIDVAVPTDVAAQGDLLCVAGGRSLVTLNVGRPDRAEVIGSAGLEGTAAAVATNGELAFVAAGSTGGYVAAVSPTRPPEVLSNPKVSSTFSGVASSGRLVSFTMPYYAWSFDIDAPDLPINAGEVTAASATPPLAIDMDGEYTYLAEGPAGLNIWRTMPTEAASYLIDGAPSTYPDMSPEAYAFSVALTGLSDGTKYFHVRTRDQAGNWGYPMHYGFTVDGTGPVVTTNADGKTHRIFTLSLAADDGAGIGVSYLQYRVDGGVWTTGDSVTLKCYGKRRTYLAATHTIDYRAGDLLGNVTNGSCQVLLAP